ncbi:hypothetical protein [Synechococcus lacustris]|uniref:hypothetical protein n=1 Tax=Synechococcus lacustris TaxID=2116544 RepID=UPI0020CEAF9F|nr:hypothetical protein [Synechococcus lacustris]MCP9795327.1 hypothetical protein [Synechococcus lacustris L1F-Slac]MCP9814289.1 hypothetical protein [Synechococcus lacustris L1E-Slac]
MEKRLKLSQSLTLAATIAWNQAQINKLLYAGRDKDANAIKQEFRGVNQPNQKTIWLPLSK